MLIGKSPSGQSPQDSFPFQPDLIGAGALIVLGLILFFLWRSIGGGGTTGVLPDATGMIRIERGAFSVGVSSPDPNHELLQQVKLDEFWIDQYEVTNEQFARFVSETDGTPPLGWTQGIFPPGEKKRPVQGVTWHEARAYCQWVKKRLPSEAEWEVAARGSQSTLYPWGDEAGTVPLPRRGSYNVGAVNGNRSRFGLFDMAGNVWEWVDKPYGPVPGGQKVLHGGSNNFLTDMAYRLVGDPNEKTMQVASGFRCAAPLANGDVNPAVTAAPAQLAPGVVFRDDFADPNGGWPVLVKDGNVIGYHPQSFYHLGVSRVNEVLTSFHADQDLGDGVVEADMLVDNTGHIADGAFRYGLAVRASDENYYAFLISPQKKWQIAKHSASGFETLAEGVEDTIRIGTNMNRLRVMLDGPKLTFEINGRGVGEVTDEAYSHGGIGFVLETFEELLAHIHFDSITIREADGTGIAVQPTATSLVEPTRPARQPTATVKPTTASTATAAPTATATPEPTVVVPPVPEGMILIPAGFFRMGSSDGRGDEKPEHPVLLDAFYIDQTEVTNAAYRECVAIGDCTRSGSPNAADDLPVMLVNWTEANAYCESAGKRLPTEAEWEFAAGGPEDLKWPWGNEFQLNLSAASAIGLRPVGSYPDGASPFGVLDMAGNVNEWVADTFDAKYYADSPTTNPFNTIENNTRLYRGGSYDNPDASYYTTSRRYVKTILFADVDVGFRCAQDASEVNQAEPRADRAARVTEFCKAHDIYKPGAPCP